MDLQIWDTCSNIVIFLFWFGIWIRADRSGYFNPYLYHIERLADSILAFLRPALFGLPSRLVAAMGVVFLLVFRAVIFQSLATSQGLSWPLTFGFVRGEAEAAIVGDLLAFSAISFAVFLFKIWGLSVLYITAHGLLTRTTEETLYEIGRPFMFLTPWLRPIALLLFGMAITWLMSLTGSSASEPVHRGTLPAVVLRYAVSSLAAWVAILNVLQWLMFVLIIGSWISSVAMRNLKRLCLDWIDLFLGPLRRHRIMFGMMDLTPILFFLALQMVIYPGLIVGLNFLYRGLP